MSAATTQADSQQRLNARQRMFARFIFEGKSQTEAYRRAYGAEGSTAEVNASRLLRNAKVIAYLERLIAEAEDDAALERKVKRQVLKRIVYTGNNSEAIRAIAEDNRMTGEYSPQRAEQELILKDILEKMDDTSGL